MNRRGTPITTMGEEKKRRRGRPSIKGLKKHTPINLSLHPDVIEFARSEAERRQISLSKLITLALEKEMSKASPEEGSPIVEFKPKPHILAAAGSPLGAEVQDWEGVNDTVLVKINGLSMVPLLNDGQVVPMHHKRGARSQFMKKGLIYLVEYGGGYTVKRYNTRVATEQEIEEGVSYLSKRDGKTKVKVLQSINPDFPEIVIKDEADWIAWVNPKEL